MIPQHIKDEFNYLIEQAHMGTLMLVETTFRHNGKPAYVIVVHDKTPTDYRMFPVAVLSRDDVGYDLLAPPEGAIEINDAEPVVPNVLPAFTYPGAEK